MQDDEDDEDDDDGGWTGILFERDVGKHAHTWVLYC